jgi:hypothetical protein
LPFEAGGAALHSHSGDTSALGSANFPFFDFFGIFFGARLVDGTDDFGFGFGFTELETAGQGWCGTPLSIGSLPPAVDIGL